MKRAFFLPAAALALASGVAVHASREAAAAQTISYGSDPLQQIDFQPASAVKGAAPLVVFVHGGGWKRGDKDGATRSSKAAHFNSLGYHFAAINYRLVPGATVEQQGEDVAHALAKLLSQADALGIDRSRVVLMGHSAGAHLVALVGTDPRYLQSAGLSEKALAGVVPIDGAAYDVPAQMQQAGRFMLGTYEAAFGTEPKRQLALSPTNYAAAPNAPAFLILHVGRKDAVAQASELERALKKAGTPVERREFPGQGLQGHAEINRNLGDPDYAATPVVDNWLARVFR